MALLIWRRVSAIDGDKRSDTVDFDHGINGCTIASDHGGQEGREYSRRRSGFEGDDIVDVAEGIGECGVTRVVVPLAVDDELEGHSNTHRQHTPQTSQTRALKAGQGHCYCRRRRRGRGREGEERSKGEGER